MFRGEILDEVGNSWFTAKSIKVEPWKGKRTSKERNKILNKRKSSEKVKRKESQETDIKCKDYMSKGKQPRSKVKIIKSKAKCKRE